ncbi:MAG: sulfite exporter TauE/SafE family protein [Pseudomonadales bacterium]
MSPEIIVLISTAATIAFVHTLMGPDHYLPFVAMGKARGWSLRRMLAVAAVCGLGHIAGSIALGFVGIGLQLQLNSLEWFEGLRGDVAAWVLLAFGLVYMVWGLRKAFRNKSHSHSHRHDGLVHSHDHSHQKEHTHVHDRAEGAKSTFVPWAIFIVFVLGPCEPLIPLLMYPAAKESVTGMVMVTGVFGLVTMLTMLGAVAIVGVGLNKIKLPRMERFGHAMAGATLASCGSAIVFLGL